jgi:DNA-binding NarL/FixJ family response regulator
MRATDAKFHCAIVDDHLMLLDLLVREVRSISGLSVVATATDVGDAMRVAAVDRLDLLIADRKLGSGDGMEVVRAVKARHPDVKVIVIAGSTADFVCPPDIIESVVAVIDKTHACETLLCEIDKALGRSADAHAEIPPRDSIRTRLTPREFELFTVLGEGLSNKEIGKRFSISTRTVETHRKAISRKLGMSGAALVRLATIHAHGGSLNHLREAAAERASAEMGSGE